MRRRDLIAAKYVDRIAGAPSPPTCLSSNRQNSSWSSTSRPRRPSADFPAALLVRADEVIE
jgi:hypothetical protein